MVWLSSEFILVNMVIFLIFQISHSKKGLYVKKLYLFVENFLLYLVPKFQRNRNKNKKVMKGKLKIEKMRVLGNSLFTHKNSKDLKKILNEKKMFLVNLVMSNPNLCSVFSNSEKFFLREDRFGGFKKKTLIKEI